MHPRLQGQKFKLQCPRFGHTAGGNRAKRTRPAPNCDVRLVPGSLESSFSLCSGSCTV